MQGKFSIRQLMGNIRKAKTLRAIEPTTALEFELLSIYRTIVEYWAHFISEKLLPTYGVTLLLLQDAASDNLASTLLSAEEGSNRLVFGLKIPLENWLKRFGQWHLFKWLSGLKNTLGIDQAPWLTPEDAPDVMRAAAERNAALIRNVSGKIQNDVATATWEAVVHKKPRTDLAKDLSKVIDGGISRAKFIARDQTNKLSANLDEFRQRQAGITQYKWLHSGKAHPRPEHVARDGKIFSWDNPPYDGHPGTLPNCGCKAMAYIPLLEEVEKEMAL